MTLATRACLNITALAIIISAGMTHGRWTGRWSGSNDLNKRAVALAQIPLTIGNWKGRELPLDRRTQEGAGIDGYAMRLYVNERGESVTALLVCGRPGPIAVHTPEVCYPGAGFEPSAAKVKLLVGSGSPRDEFWVAEFHNQESALQKNLRIFYAWSTDGSWSANETPRLGFANSPILYKLYVVRDRPKPGEPPQEDSAAEFLAQFLPEVRKTLFSRS